MIEMKCSNCDGDIASVGTGEGAAVFCPNCGARAPQVSLEINLGRFYMIGRGGVLDFRLRNRSETPVDGLVLSVRGDRLCETQQRRIRLGAGGTSRPRIQIEPEAAGERLLELSLRYGVDDEESTWSAEYILPILDESTTPQHFSLVLDQRISAGRNVGGVSSRTELKDELLQAISKGVVRTANDLLSEKFDEYWEQIPLAYDEDGTRDLVAEPPSQICIVDALADGRAPLDRATLHLDGSAERRILLLGTRHVRMGRSSSCADVVLRLMPRSGENDSQSVLISGSRKTGRAHLTLSLTKAGLTLEDHESTNGTWLNGRPVDGKADVPTDQPSELDVGKALRLRLVPFHCEQDDTDQYEPIATPDPLWHLAAEFKLRSLLIERMGNLEDEEKYLVVYRWAQIGGGGDCEIRAAGDAPPQARVLRLGGQFWLEGLADPDPISAENHLVPLGSACPLAVGMHLACGDSRFRVTDFEQYTA